ncbi:hypothetical protein EASAB2608_06567 [Streptomyces sp. EAS-AB2608]|uniref:DUF317 domain-containing protein n=1 Tax=Streptomyces sp. EAS-AB2608 TaxID=2779671 RepID=UPI001BEDD58D|nr:DUF317 domain-containing protein [Streptomyces sp. EAS-AB2608]BCM71233.1 hypothetical protein EASAB2608_06567 [Streptomyces sp. EAS-AB2608]
MTTPSIDAHVHFDAHPTHPSAVTATVTGSQTHVALIALEADGWETVAENTLLLARIDHEEPYWANKAAQQLNAAGIKTEISSRLRKAIDEEWTWANYPMPWCTRAEIREVSNQAQNIYDDIRHGRLLIHAHAEDDHTTVAVGTYRDTGKSVYLHGENHLRQIADTFDSPAQALTAFERIHGGRMRPGPAPVTDTERQAAEARASLGTPAPNPEPSAAPQNMAPDREVVPAYAADPSDHDAILEEFLIAHDDWEKWRTWSDGTTHAIHESQTFRIERVHEADPRDTSWTVAAYETPVSDRMWHLTATGATPAPIIKALLTVLATDDAMNTDGDLISENGVREVTRPLADVGWQHTDLGRYRHWKPHSGEVGLILDVLAAQDPHDISNTWTIWAGHNLNRPDWTINASNSTPVAVLSHLAGELAHGIGTTKGSTQWRGNSHSSVRGVSLPRLPAKPSTGRTP